MIDDLINVLVEVKSRCGADFSGVGIIVCDQFQDLPVFPIRLASPSIGGRSLVDELTEICSMQSEFHDGFHIVSSSLQLISVSQYFSPPIVEAAKVDRTKRFGGRYLAALFGSSLPSVSAIGIASNGFGLAIFNRGEEVYFSSI